MILITGGAGFIGSSVADRLLSEGNEVRIIDNFDQYYPPEIKKKNIENALESRHFELFQGDITKRDDIKKAMDGVDTVVHEAAQPGVRISVDNPEKTNHVNVNGTLNVLLAARDMEIKKIIFASSSSVYGKITYLPFDEKHPTEPLSPYGVSKLACEHYARLFSQIYGLDITVLRYFTVYGPRMRPDLAISTFFRKACSNQPIEIFGDGKKSRDFTYIDDAVDATLIAIKKNPNEIYNIGGGNRITIKELLDEIISITKSTSKIIYKEEVKGDVAHTMANSEKAEKELGWKPKTKINDGLEHYFRWLMKNKK